MARLSIPAKNVLTNNQQNYLHFLPGPCYLLSISIVLFQGETTMLPLIKNSLAGRIHNLCSRDLSEFYRMKRLTKNHTTGWGSNHSELLMGRVKLDMFYWNELAKFKLITPYQTITILLCHLTLSPYRGCILASHM